MQKILQENCNQIMEVGNVNLALVVQEDLYLGKENYSEN